MYVPVNLLNYYFSGFLVLANMKPNHQYVREDPDLYDST